MAEEIFRKAICTVLTVGPRVAVKAPGPVLKQILYLTNLREESHSALDYAISLASHCGAQLMLLHVVEQDEPNPPDQESLRSYRSILHNLLPQGCGPFRGAGAVRRNRKESGGPHSLGRR